MFSNKRLFILIAILLGITCLAAIIAGDGGGIVVTILLIAAVVGLIPLSKLVNSNQVARALRGLEEDETVRYQYTAPFVGFGDAFVILTTKRLIIPSSLSRRNGSIPFDQIYLANTGGRSVGVGAYGHGLIIGTTVTDKYLELDLINDDVVRIRVRRPHVLHQRLMDAYTEWVEDK